MMLAANEATTYPSVGMNRSGARRRVRDTLGAIFTLMSLHCGAAQAQVLEIGDEGQVTVHAGPVVFTQDGTMPIQAPPVMASVAGDIRLELAAAARAHALDPNLLEAVAWQESRFRQDALSPKGATGVMQLMPGTAKALGVDRFDRSQNIAGGAAYLARMMRQFGGSQTLALAAYNAGPGAVLRYGTVPPYAETRRYVANVMQRVATLAAYRSPVIEGLIP